MNQYTFKKIINILIETILIVTAVQLHASEQKRIAVRFIYAQGFLACHKRFDKPIAQFAETVQQAQLQNKNLFIDHATYYHCFDAGYLAHPGDDTEHLFRTYITADGTRHGTDDVSPFEAADNIVNNLETEAARLEEHGFTLPLRVYLVGHSHGGWLTMQMVAKLADNPRIKVMKLTTVDPISYTLCPSSSFLTNVAVNSIPTWSETTPDDCHQAPRDLRDLGPTIRKTTDGQWNNFYQSSMPYLRSGPIAEATWNVDFPWLTTYDYWNGHRSLLSDPRSLRGLYLSLTADLNEIAAQP